MGISRAVRPSLEHRLHWGKVRASLRGTLHFSDAPLPRGARDPSPDLLADPCLLAEQAGGDAYGSRRGADAGWLSGGRIRLDAPRNAGGGVRPDHRPPAG